MMDCAPQSETKASTTALGVIKNNTFDQGFGKDSKSKFLKEKFSLENNDWELIWSDEFSGKGKPDSTKWSYDLGMMHNHELQYYTSNSANARLENGNLILEAVKETVNNDDYQQGATSWRNKNKEASYTSARLTTHKKAAWRYGRMEARAKLPKAVDCGLPSGCCPKI